MKRAILIGMIIVATLFVLSGCGDDDTDNEDTKPVVVEDMEEIIDTTDDTTEDTTDEVEDTTEDVVEDDTTDDVVEDVVDDTTDDVVEDDTTEDVVEDDTTEDNETELSAQNFKVVSIKNFKPYPEELTIKVGTTVEFRNINDNFLHIIAWAHMGTRAEGMMPGESWRYTFTKPGKIIWFSTAKPTIQGKITIEE